MGSRLQFLTASTAEVLTITLLDVYGNHASSYVGGVTFTTPDACTSRPAVALVVVAFVAVVVEVVIVCFGHGELGCLGRCCRVMLTTLSGVRFWCVANVVALSGGFEQESVTVNTAGSATFTATKSGLTSASLTLDVAAGSFSSLEFENSTITVTAGDSSVVSVYSVDTQGNRLADSTSVTSYALLGVALHVEMSSYGIPVSSIASVSPSATYLIGGEASVSFSGTTAGSYLVNMRIDVSVTF